MNFSSVGNLFSKGASKVKMEASLAKNDLSLFKEQAKLSTKTNYKAAKSFITGKEPSTIGKAWDTGSTIAKKERLEAEWFVRDSAIRIKHGSKPFVDSANNSVDSLASSLINKFS